MTEPQDPTQLGAPIAPTEMSGVVDFPPTGESFAWAEDDGGDDPAARWWSAKWVTVAAVAGCGAAVIGAGAIAYPHLRPEPQVIVKLAPAPTPASIAPPPVAAEPPPPATVTIHAPPASTMQERPPEPAPVPINALARYDAMFVSSLQQHGWVVTDMTSFVDKAHLVCTLFNNGANQQFVNQKFVNETGLGFNYAMDFTTTAMLIYPNCIPR